MGPMSSMDPWGPMAQEPSQPVSDFLGRGTRAAVRSSLVAQRARSGYPRTISACSVAVSYKPPMLVTRVRLPACALNSKIAFSRPLYSKGHQHVHSQRYRLFPDARAERKYSRHRPRTKPKSTNKSWTEWAGAGAIRNACRTLTEHLRNTSGTIMEHL